MVTCFLCHRTNVSTLPLGFHVVYGAHDTPNGKPVVGLCPNTGERVPESELQPPQAPEAA